MQLEAWPGDRDMDRSIMCGCAQLPCNWCMMLQREELLNESILRHKELHQALCAQMMLRCFNSRFPIFGALLECRPPASPAQTTQAIPGEGASMPKGKHRRASQSHEKV